MPVFQAKEVGPDAHLELQGVRAKDRKEMEAELKSPSAKKMD